MRAIAESLDNGMRHRPYTNYCQIKVDLKALEPSISIAHSHEPKNIQRIRWQIRWNVLHSGDIRQFIVAMGLVIHRLTFRLSQSFDRANISLFITSDFIGCRDSSNICTFSHGPSSGAKPTALGAHNLAFRRPVLQCLKSRQFLFFIIQHVARAGDGGQRKMWMAPEALIFCVAACIYRRVAMHSKWLMFANI